MGTLEQYQAIADKINKYDIRFTDVWTKHLSLKFEPIVLFSTLKYPDTFTGMLFQAPSNVDVYGMVCRITGSLFHFKIKTDKLPDDPVWDDPAAIRDELEKTFNFRYKNRKDGRYSNGKYGSSHMMSTAVAVKLDYDHHCATLNAIAQ